LSDNKVPTSSDIHLKEREGGRGEKKKKKKKKKKGDEEEEEGCSKGVRRVLEGC
jgi:hypothetical protein